jgi:hypothetical protein
MFFGLDWAAALIKISFQIVFSIVTAIPFYFAWNAVASTYFTFLPEIYWDISYWDLVGILLVTIFLGEMIQKLTPKIFSVSQSNTTNANNNAKNKD